MDSKAIIARDDAHVLHTYARSPLALVRGEGLYAYDAEGRRYLDFTSGIGVNALGYCHPAWVRAVAAQAGQLQHTSNLYYTAPCGALAEALCRRTGLDAVFFGNSGAEANEGAIKAARKYSADTYGPGRDRVLTLVNSFHGRTLATLTATGQDVFHRDFGPFPEKFAYVPAGDFAALQAAAAPDTCAVLLELVQGEGGVVALEKDYVARVAQLCKERDILLLVDEVQTGVGRTGYFFSYQGCGVQPDVVTAAKGLGGGLPIAACLVSDALKDIFTPGMNGSTFGSNPVASAGALEMVTRIDNADFLAAVREKGEYFRAALSKMENVACVRGRGLMLGIRVKDRDAHDVMEACAKAGLLILTAKDMVRFLPPLTITKEEIDAGLAIFAEQIGG